MIKKKSILMLIICFCYISLSFMGNIQISVYANEYDINDLSKSIIENNKKLVKKIINKNGIDINQKDSDGRYPLEKVLVMGNCEMAKLLLDNGANPFVITKGGQSIYKKVMNTTNKTLKKIFEEKAKKYNNYSVNQLSQAVLENDIKTVNIIIDSNTVNLNQRNSDGNYPLEMILVMGNCDMAKILLNAGANPYLKTKSGKTIYELVMNQDNKKLKEIFKNTNQ